MSWHRPSPSLRTRGETTKTVRSPCSKYRLAFSTMALITSPPPGCSAPRRKSRSGGDLPASHLSLVAHSPSGFPGHCFSQIWTALQFNGPDHLECFMGSFFYKNELPSSTMAVITSNVVPGGSFSCGIVKRSSTRRRSSNCGTARPPAKARHSADAPPSPPLLKRLMKIGGGLRNDCPADGAGTASRSWRRTRRSWRACWTIRRRR